MRRGEVLLVIGEDTENEQWAADIIRRDRRLWAAVHSGDAGNCKAARYVRRRGSNSDSDALRLSFTGIAHEASAERTATLPTDSIERE